MKVQRDFVKFSLRNKKDTGFFSKEQASLSLKGFFFFFFNDKYIKAIFKIFLIKLKIGVNVVMVSGNNR